MAVGLADPVIRNREAADAEAFLPLPPHTATSWFKAVGVTDGIVRGIVGQKSVAMSKAYTHQDVETTRAALQKLHVFQEEESA